MGCVGGFAHELVAGGARGSRVALVCANSIDLAIAMFAAHAAGAQAVPINPAYTGREIRHILADAEPHVVVYDAEVATIVEPLLKALDIRLGVRLAGESGSAGRRLDTWRDDDELALPQPLPSPADPATLQYTGGTTGLPKG